MTARVARGTVRGRKNHKITIEPITPQNIQILFLFGIPILTLLLDLGAITRDDRPYIADLKMLQTNFTQIKLVTDPTDPSRRALRIEFQVVV